MTVNKNLILTILTIAFFTTVFGQSVGPYGSIISSLGSFQDRSGGFSLKAGDAPTLRATENALSLYSLYGLTNNMDTQPVLTYLASLRNADNGFADQNGGMSSIMATRNALRCYQYLHSAPTHPDLIAKYVLGLSQSHANFFFAPSSDSRERADVHSTAAAFEIFEMLGLEDEINPHMKEQIRTILEENTSENIFDFGNPNYIQANYFGIVVASHVDYVFDDIDAWASSVASFQNANGAFYEGEKTGLIITKAAVDSLHVLGKLANEDYLTFINTRSISKFCRDIPYNLQAAAAAHDIVSGFDDFLQTSYKYRVNYETHDSPAVGSVTIEQGTTFRPILLVTAFDAVSISHLDVSCRLTHDGETTQYLLEYSYEHRGYVSDELFDTSEKLGSLEFVFDLHQEISSHGSKYQRVTDSKEIGYGANLTPSAVHELTERDVPVGEVVSVGTKFDFGISFSNRTDSDIVSGDFVVIFSVLDSSNIVIATESLSGYDNDEEFQFTYTLRDSNIPSGDLNFQFQVVDDIYGTHTTYAVGYKLSVPMVATNIEFIGQEGEEVNYNLGDSIRFKFQPATFPDLREVHPLESFDFNGEMVSGQRKFILVLSTVNGVRIATIPSAVSSDSYEFNFVIPKTFDYIGETVLSINYQTASGEQITLDNYDSSFNELYDDSFQLKYTVNYDFHMADVTTQPESSEFFYGEEVEFSFQVIDSISGENVKSGYASNVIMTLHHQDEVRDTQFTSAQVYPKRHSKEDGIFDFNWHVNPNAVKGDGLLTLTILDVDGNEITLFGAQGSTDPAEYRIKIGGDITVKSSTFSTEDINHLTTSIGTEFSLECHNTPLENAKLRSIVFFSKTPSNPDSFEEVSSLPVSGIKNSYSASLNKPHRDVKSGTYRIDVFREIDIERSEDIEHWVETQVKLQRREAELNQQKFDEAATRRHLKSENSLQPLLSVSIDHTQISTSPLTFRLEWVAFIIFLAGFIWINKIKYKYSS